MEVLLNENDLIIGAIFDNGTIKDYVDDKKTYGLIRIENTTANWFLYNDIDNTPDTKELYEKVTKDVNHFIHDEYGEKIVVFNKEGEVSFEQIVQKIDDYLNDGVF